MVRDADELESAPVPDSVEGNEIKEQISEDWLEGLNGLDQVKNEVSEAITSQGLEAERQALTAKEQVFLFTSGRRAVSHTSIIRKKRVFMSSRHTKANTKIQWAYIMSLLQKTFGNGSLFEVI